MTASVDKFDCPKCGMVDEPYVRYAFDPIACGKQAHYGEHLDLSCRRCGYGEMTTSLNQKAGPIPYATSR